MSSLRRALLVMAFLAVPGVAAAQGPGGGPFMGRNSVNYLIENREQLKLTADQAKKLEEIGQKLLEKNRPIFEQMQAMRPAGGFQGLSQEEREARRQAMAPLMEKLRANDEEAVKEALAVLSPEQQKVANQLLEERRGRMRNWRPGT